MLTLARTVAAAAVVLAIGCVPAAPPPQAAPATPAALGPTAASTATERAKAAPPARDRAHPAEPAGEPRPRWLGTRVLPRRADGYGEIRPTPRVLRDRRLRTVDLLPRPATSRFTSRVTAVPDHVLERSTWSRGCPVTHDELRYVTVTFWGFDEVAHTGELLVHRDAADDLVEVFRRLYRSRFPIEEMRVVAPPEVDLPPTGDGNNTTAFVCRPSRGSTSWSQHAYGLAVDVNPFHNPYVKGDVVLPELASAYTDRERHRPGMHLPGGESVRAFRTIGWEWGGDWDSPKDPMHFSANGR